MRRGSFWLLSAITMVFLTTTPLRPQAALADDSSTGSGPMNKDDCLAKLPPIPKNFCAKTVAAIDRANRVIVGDQTAVLTPNREPCRGDFSIDYVLNEVSHELGSMGENFPPDFGFCYGVLVMTALDTCAVTTPGANAGDSWDCRSPDPAFKSDQQKYSQFCVERTQTDYRAAVRYSGTLLLYAQKSCPNQSADQQDAPASAPAPAPDGN